MTPSASFSSVMGTSSGPTRALTRPGHPVFTIRTPPGLARHGAFRTIRHTDCLLDCGFPSRATRVAKPPEGASSRTRIPTGDQFDFPPDSSQLPVRRSACGTGRASRRRLSQWQSGRMRSRVKPRMTQAGGRLDRLTAGAGARSDQVRKAEPARSRAPSVSATAPCRTARTSSAWSASV